MNPSRDSLSREYWAKSSARRSRTSAVPWCATASSRTPLTGRSAW